MQLGPKELDELEVLAFHAARRAGEMIAAQAKEDFEVLGKEAGSSAASQALTEVDLESQRMILEALEESIERFDLGLLTEESPDDSSRHQHDHFWCIDPLDGTLAFTKGSPGYSLSIALVARDGTPKIGVVHDPVEGTTYHAIAGQGARRNNDVWVPSPAANDALSLFIDHSFIGQAAEPAFREKLEALATQNGCEGFEIIDHQGAVLNACGVAERGKALYFKPPKTKPGGGSLWDFAATACLFSELGLPCSDFHGQPLHLNPQGDTFMNHKGVCFASSKALADIPAQLG